MDINEAMDKGKKVVQENIDKMEAARRSEGAEKVRDNVVDGFEKFMKTIIPGSDKEEQEAAAQRMVEADPDPDKHLPSN